MGFRGNFLNKFDDAGRLSLPAKMREELRSSFQDDSLIAYVLGGIVKLFPKKIYDERMKSMEEQVKGDSQAYAFYKKLSSISCPIDINGSGRMNIPSHMREEAQLGPECYILGIGDVIELWNKDRWNANNLEIDLTKASDIESLKGFADMLGI